MSKRTAAILLSRQQLRPSGKAAWVKQSIAAVRWLKSQELVLHSSVGMQTWELLTSVASLEGIELTLSVPAVSSHEFERLKRYATDQFDLKLDLINFHPVLGEKRNTTKEELWLSRDKHVVETADVLLPVSLRKRGRMDSMLQRFCRQGKSVENRFRVDYEKRTQSLAYRLKVEQLNPKLRQLGDQHLIHWTRSANSAWPTEKLIDYYKAVTESESFPRNAFSTLMNIISTKKIVATPKNMPAGIPTVSFSRLAPADIVPLVKWRSRFRQMSFEPYGIGIEKQYAVSKGIYPVRYYLKNRNRTDDGEQWLCQSVGEKGDWRAEQEYRHEGNLDLSSFPPNLLLLFCRTQREAEIIEKNTGFQAVSFIT